MLETELELESYDKIFWQKTDKSILTDLNAYPLTEDVKLKAEEVYKSMILSTKRKKKRKIVIFYCIITAYKILNQVYDPKSVASIVGIENKDMSKALSLCSTAQTGYRSPNVEKRPQDFLAYYIEAIRLTPDSIDIVKDIADTVTKNDPELLQFIPQTVAVGIIMYYMETYGIIYNKYHLAQTVKLSDVTLGKIKTRIAAAHNM
ncbi:hypothetical protein D3C87_887580 [compost metagenome]